MKHLVLIPSYNTGPILHDVVHEALANWPDVWVVIDGSTDRSHHSLINKASVPPGLKILVRSSNGGKGAAVLHGLNEAKKADFTHALIMDADGQHPASLIQEFISVSREHPDAMILGTPAFGSEAPQVRVKGRRICIWWTNFETLWGGIGDSLFGFRVYPVSPLLRVFSQTSHARGFDFDPEVTVRLFWEGVTPINRQAPVRYLKKEDGGVSHFHYGRDNIKLIVMHVRLAFGLLRRLPRVYRLRKRAITAQRSAFQNQSPRASQGPEYSARQK
ncbi:MAG: glycosyltransferase family 2 protein [Opitutales bacterium]